MQIAEPEDDEALGEAPRRRVDRPRRRARPAIELLPESIWREVDSIEVLADFNAAEPLGIEGTDAQDDFEELRRQARARRAGDRRAEDEGAQGLHRGGCSRPTTRSSTSTASTRSRRSSAEPGADRGRASPASTPGRSPSSVCALDGGAAAARGRASPPRRSAPTRRRWSTRCSPTRRSTSCSARPATACRSSRPRTSASASSR